MLYNCFEVLILNEYINNDTVTETAKMNDKGFILNYWRQYKLLEKDFIDTADYVSISKQNNSTFSNEYLKLILCICGEIDSLTAVLVPELAKNNSVPARLDAFFKMKNNFRFVKIQTRFPFEKIHLTPFVKFDVSESGAGSAPWWKAYNELKHNRFEELPNGRNVLWAANLENALNAMAALYALLCELSSKCGINEDDIYMKPRLFESEHN